MLQPGSGTQTAVLSSGPSRSGRSQGRCESRDQRLAPRAWGRTQPASVQGTGPDPPEGQEAEPIGWFSLFPPFSHL